MIIVESKRSVLDWLSTAVDITSHGPLHLTPMEFGTPFEAHFNERKNLTHAWVNGKEVDAELFHHITGMPLRIQHRNRFPPLKVEGVIAGVPDDINIEEVFDGHRVQRLGYISGEWLTIMADEPKLALNSLYMRERFMVQHKLRRWAAHIEWRPSWTLKSVERELDLLRANKNYRGIRFSVNDNVLREKHAHPDCMLRLGTQVTIIDEAPFVPECFTPSPIPAQ